MKIYARLLCLLPLLAPAAHANGYPQVTLKADSIICYDRSDWDDLVAASIDQDIPAMSRLVSSGDCRVINQAVQVSYLDPANDGNDALIQMRSGKTAYTASSAVGR